jgi:Tfp pilus assembly protein PilN
MKMAIGRMNFLQRSGATLTYRTMVKFVLAWFIFMGLVYGVQMLRSYLLGREMASARESVEQLNAKKSVHLRRVEAVSRQRVGASTKETLGEILQTAPHWSMVLKALTSRLPAQVWLDVVKVELDEDDQQYIVMKGKASSQRELTNFILSLESSSRFARTVLVGTKHAGGKSKDSLYEITTYPLLSKF